jgi:hypothetical protein
MEIPTDIEVIIEKLRQLLFNEIHVLIIQGKNHNEIVSLFGELFSIAEESSDSYVLVFNSIICLDGYHDLIVAHLFNHFKNNIDKLIATETEISPSWFTQRLEQKDFESISKEFNSLKEFIKQSGALLNNLDEPIEIPATVNKSRLIHFVYFNIFGCIRRTDCISNNNRQIKEDLTILCNLVRNEAGEERIYLLISDVIQALQNSQQFQAAREIADIALKQSSRVNKIYGAFVFVDFYNRSNNALATLINLNFLVFLFLHGAFISKLLLHQIYWQLLVFCRNQRPYVDYGKTFYSKIYNDQLSFEDKNMYSAAYFYMLANIYDNTLPQLLFDFLGKHVEEFKSAPADLKLSWFVLLMRIKKEQNEFGLFDVQKLEKLIEYFKSSLPSDQTKKYDNYLFGDLQTKKNDLGKAFQDLSLITNKKDFVSENKFAISLANGLLKESAMSADFNGYLLSMIVKADLSSVFEIKNEFLLQNNKPGFLNQQVELIQFYRDFNFIILGNDGETTHPLYFGNKILFVRNKEWTIRSNKTFFDSTVSKLSFRPGYADAATEYANSKSQLYNSLIFSVFPEIFTNEVLVVKDMELGYFPHNLLIDPEGFVLDRFPISNILSLEWLTTKLKLTTKLQFDISMWIPIGLAFEFAILNNQLEQLVIDNSIKLENSPTVPSKLSSSINILVAHGSNNISNFPALHFSNVTDNTTLDDLDSVIGDGKVLILFVCHGGQAKPETFRNQVSSLPTYYLSKGYEAVIAPFWSLSTEIPPKWLPEFMQSLKAGMKISTAVWNANQKVKEKFDTPSAYACMHLYGNPFMAIYNHT